MKRSKLLVTLLAIFAICLTFSIALIAFADESEIGDALSNGRVTQEVTGDNELKITLAVTDMSIGDTRAYYKQPVTLDMENNKWFEMNFTIDEFNVDGGLRISFLSSSNDFPMDVYGAGFGVYFWDETAWGYSELQAFRSDFYKYGKTAGFTGLIDAKAVRSDTNKITGQSFHLKVWEYDADNIAIQVDRDDNGTTIQAIGAFSKSNLPEGFDIKNCTLMITPDVDINRAHSYEKDIVLTIKDINGAKPVTVTAPAETTYSQKDIGTGTAIGVWLQGDNHSATLEFTTAGGFKGFGLPIYWASNANVPNGPFAKYKIELFKFEYNPEYTLSQAPVKSYELDGQGDNNPAFAFNFDEPLEAGTYIARFTITNFDEILRGKMNGQGDDVDMTPYLVLPKMDANPDPAKFVFSTADAFNFYVVGEDGIETFYLANPENTDSPSQPTTQPATQPETQPETQPQTGDATVAMFAVIVVLTLGAVIVFAKKRSF